MILGGSLICDPERVIHVDVISGHQTRFAPFIAVLVLDVPNTVCVVDTGDDSGIVYRIVETAGLQGILQSFQSSITGTGYAPLFTVVNEIEIVRIVGRRSITIDRSRIEIPNQIALQCRPHSLRTELASGLGCLEVTRRFGLASVILEDVDLVGRVVRQEIDVNLACRIIITGRYDYRSMREL